MPCLPSEFVGGLCPSLSLERKGREQEVQVMMNGVFFRPFGELGSLTLEARRRTA